MGERNKIIKKNQDIIDATDVSYQELSDKTRISKSTLQRYATGETKKLPLDRVELIAQALDISTASLLGWNDDISSNVVREDGAEYDALGKSSSIRINVYSSVHAGFPQEAEDNIVDWEEIPREWTRGNQEYIGIKVEGDCMAPKYIEGDTIIVRLQETCENGQDVVAYVNGFESQLRRYTRQEDRIILQSITPSYLPETYFINDPDNSVVIVGVVVEIRRKVQK